MGRLESTLKSCNIHDLFLSWTMNIQYIPNNTPHDLCIMIWHQWEWMTFIFRWAISINEYFDDLTDTLTFHEFIIMRFGLTESEQTLHNNLFFSFTDSQRW